MHGTDTAHLDDTAALAASTKGELVTVTRTESSSSRPGRPAGARGSLPTRFVRESVSEMRKVLWPSRSELVTYSIVVIVFVVIMVAIVSGLDIGLAKLVLVVFG
jgi:preprotein translocase subunit SecE